ncbi:MAG TPA: response regulator [Candidatus Dormibacteraeota bacterium]|nr:response regulator [Candidatus Dormibacteraeota bacterium]
MKTVLVVDDDPDMRFMLKLLLERGGYQVNEASDGLAALHAIRAQMPDLVLTDLRMPMMDGAELILRLRSEPPTAEMPIILITAYAVLPDTAKLADETIPKPFAPERVVETVTRLLGGRRASDRPAVQNGD